MKKLYFLVFIIIIFSLNIFSQKQGNIWYFGEHAGLDFNYYPPLPITDGMISSPPMPPGNYNQEGCSTICDSTGTLLLYTDGNTIWDKNHQIINNGDSLMGHRSSTQAALILPKPNSNDIFYVFTTDGFQNEFNNGLRYSVVDMCNDNYCTVIQGEKNILLLDTASEKLTAVKHNNNTDYWIVTVKHFTNSYYSFLLTSNGIADTVISNVGTIHTGGGTGYLSALGQMKASPNGEKIAMVIGQQDSIRLEIFDFCDTTGVLSNPITIPDNNGLYGVSFSPDNSKLYITKSLINFQLIQYNLSAGSGHPDSIIASKFIIPLTNRARGLQLGPDGKIYTVTGNDNYLGLIEYPDSAQSACNYINDAIYLNGASCVYSLPNYIDSYNYHNTILSCSPTHVHREKVNMPNIFPNPTTGLLRINNEELIIKNVAVYDIYGKEVLKQEVGIQKYVIDLSNQPKGIYIVKVITDKQTITRKVIKQ